MRGNIWKRVLVFLKKRMRDKRWRRVMTCLAAVVVFMTTYALILPAVSMTKNHPTLSADALTAWSGDRMTVRVDAYAEEGKGEKTFVLVSEAEGADLSPEYSFDENGICVITDDTGETLELHRALGEINRKETVYYWFTLEEGRKSTFALDLLDEESEERAAATAALMKRIAEEERARAQEEEAAQKEEAAQQATASDASRAETPREPGRATPSEAERRSGKASRATASDAAGGRAVPKASPAEAELPAEAPTEENDSGFTELLDGEIINDLETEAEEGEPTEVVARLKLSAGIGTDTDKAFRDASRNADKRGDAQLLFLWKNAAEGRQVTPEMFWSGDGAQVAVIFDGDARLPEGAVLSVEEIPYGSDTYLEYLSRAQGAVITPENSASEERGVNFARFFDISILDADGNEVEPAAPVKVVITCDETIRSRDEDDVNVLHFSGGYTPDVLSAEAVNSGSGAGEGADAVSFTAETFSVYGVVTTTIEKTVLASDGHNYLVSVTCAANAGIPGGAELEVREILPEEDRQGDAEYAQYEAMALEALGWGERSLSYARFFDISILKDGERVQPAAGNTVKVQIRLDDKDHETEPQVVHFGNETEVLWAQTAGTTVSFETAGFSVYGIVDAPEPAAGDAWVRVTTLAELAELGKTGLYAGHASGYYLTNRQQTISGTRTGITKTAKSDDPEAVGAALYYFDLAEGTENQFHVWCLGENGEKQYVRQNANSLSFVSSLSDATRFTAALHRNDTECFTFTGTGGYCWNMQGGTNGATIAAYNNLTDANAKIRLQYYMEMEDDPFGLNGKSFGIAYHNDTAAAAALMAEKKDETHLAAVDMLMRPDVLKNEGVLLVAENSVITRWTFESMGRNRYYISADTEDGKKYLTLSGSALTLSDTPDEEKSLFSIQSGTGAESGKYQFRVGEYRVELNLNGSSTDKGFWGVKSNYASSWLNLVSKSVLEDDDFNLYQARKVSVSDTENVKDGQQVVIYTRIWNDTAKKYEFYAVDRDGSLIRCYDTGDGIEWIGSQVNTAVWEFKEYKNADGTVNYYYELKNTQYGSYIAPQVTGGQILSGSTIGINLNGRRYGENYTTIIAWDEDHYAYAGLKTEDGHIVSCPLSEAEDFYFAVVETKAEALTTVETVDSSAYGITMKMIDFNNPIVGERDSVQHAFFGSHENKHEMGLLTTNLTDGYPSTTPLTGHEAPLSDLFKDMTDVNHLFIQSIYNESGYFEYSSTQNFAHLNDDGDFTVYDQIAAIGASTGPTRTHGQFMPYNTIQEGVFAKDNKGNIITNQTDVLQKELPDTDPRKGEKLYSIPQNEADYYFGMEMSADFTQTASGLDAWGHDIIFEFSGDDDFWLYVDDELVLDLGGVRSALTGSVNFRTGEVVNAGTKTTLYDTFKKNYKARGLSDEEISTKLAEIFTQNGDGQYVFRDYTNHTMKMFYMERGAGASNLHMRFNLAAVKPGSFILGKTLSGTESASNSLAEFPFQVWYTSSKDGRPHLLGENSGEAESVTYRGTRNSVRYGEIFTPAGGTDSYSHVFFLKPGQYAEVPMPDDVVDYYVVECGVNPAVYDEVRVNGEKLEGTETGNSVGGTARCDYRTGADTLANRSEVDFDNHVDESAVRRLSLTKILYDADGSTLLKYPADKTEFTFRLYLGNENDDPENLPAANMYSYHVLDPEGYYCRWDDGGQCFVSLGTKDYAELSDSEKESAVFTTSIYGTIARIPADHTVVVRDLIAGTMFRVEERANEIPKGYTLRLLDGYTRKDDGHEYSGYDPINGTIEVDNDPEIEIRNQKGWGLTVEKVWTDADFMETHDPVYFAVYVKDDADASGYRLLEDSVRQLASPAISVYYFFGNLVSGTPFQDYIVREVIVAPGESGSITVGEDGAVSGYGSLEPVSNGGSLSVGGRPVGGNPDTVYSYTYKVSYQPGEQTTQNENVRTDTVTNSRPGIKIYKTDLSGAPLAGAKFTLQDEQGKDVAAADYTSSNDGLVTIAYLSQGEYTLKETAAPKGYVVLPESITVTVGEDDDVTVTGPEGLYTVTTDESAAGGMTAVIYVKNRPSAFQVKKVDDLNGEPLQGVHFALYPQVTDKDGNPRKDYQPMTGFEDLVTDGNGILDRISMDLGAGTFYLTETQAAEGYTLLKEDLCFTIGADGTVTLHNEDLAGWLTSSEDGAGNISYTLTVRNGRTAKVRIKKILIDKSSEVLEGAEFTLYRAEDYDDSTRKPKAGAAALLTGVTDADGRLDLGSLSSGEYRLVEETAPAGYNLMSSPVSITVAARGAEMDVSAIQGGAGSTVTKEGDVFLIEVWNTAGYALPSTGGAGRRAVLISLTGLALILGTVMAYGVRKMKKHF